MSAVRRVQNPQDSNALARYRYNMVIPITDELRDALKASPDGVVVEDQDAQRTYIVADSAVHEEAMQALRRERDRQSIERGIADMEAGRTMSIDEADQQIRESLGFPSAQ